MVGFAVITEDPYYDTDGVLIEDEDERVEFLDYLDEMYEESLEDFEYHGA